MTASATKPTTGTSAKSPNARTHHRVLSGVQPSGKLHLGNYFGAIRQFLALQQQYDSYFFIADLHSLTSVRNADTMRDYVSMVAMDYLALGLDPKRCTIFRQSDVPEVSELNWILTAITPMGLLERATSYKDKVANGISPDAGLFTYPVLMAADVLMYRGTLVPVGKDQKQHLEIARDIAVKFNMTYCPGFDPHSGSGGVLELPDPMILEDVATVPGTDGRKMSKSYGNTIDLFGDDKALKKSVMKVVTDSKALEEPKDPATCHVFALLKLFCTEAELADVEAKYRAGGHGYGTFKTMLLDKIHEMLDPARKRREELVANPDYVNAVLKDGAAKARLVAGDVLLAVQKACGLK